MVTKPGKLEVSWRKEKGKGGLEAGRVKVVRGER